MRTSALARTATTGIHLVRGISRNLQRAARVRAVSEGTTLRTDGLRTPVGAEPGPGPAERS